MALQISHSSEEDKLLATAVKTNSSLLWLISSCAAIQARTRITPTCVGLHSRLKNQQKQNLCSGASQGIEYNET